MSENRNLTPVWIIYVDGKRLDVKHEGALRRIVVKDTLNAISSFSVLFDSGETKILTEKVFSRGSKVSIHLGYKDDVEEVFSGVVSGFRSIFAEYGTEQVEVLGASVLYKLNRGLHFRSFEEQAPSDIISGIIDTYSLQADVDSFGSTQTFSSQDGESDYEFILRLAKRYGLQVFAHEDTVYVKDEISIRTDEIIFEWGKSLISFEATQDEQGLLSGCDYIGWDYLKNESFVGNATIDDVRVKVGGSTNWTSNTDGSDTAVSTLHEHGILDSEDAKQLAIGCMQSNSFTYSTASGVAEGNYKLHPGMRVMIKITNEDSDGEYVADSVTHSFSHSEGYKTSFVLKRNMLT